jgi:hypothetical protein
MRKVKKQIEDLRLRVDHAAGAFVFFLWGGRRGIEFALSRPPLFRTDLF